MIRTIAVFLAALALLIYPACAANEGFNTLILGLPAASTPLTGNEAVPLVQGGTSKSINPQVILQMMTGDCTAIGVVVTCNKTGGTILGPLATLTTTYVANDLLIGGGGVPAVDSGVQLNTVPNLNSTFSNGVINVTGPAYGAKGNVLGYADGTVASSSSNFSSNSATFTSADVGKSIIIDYAGASAAPLVTTISGFTDSHHVTLANNASTSVPYITTWSCVPTTAQSGAGSYAPGDTITLAGGTSTTATVCTVHYTKVMSVVINAAGTSASINTGSGTGQCTIQGTTGAGAQLFKASAQVTGGALSSINSVTVAGAYTTNPTSLSAEPVNAVDGCVGLTGATVTVVMGVLTARPTTPGVYSSYPASPVAQGSTSGVGTGATFSPQTITAGAFLYGNDDTTAITAAVNAAIAQNNNPGGPDCVYLPQGAYLVSSPMPTFFHVNGCIQGAGRKKTWIFVNPSMSGDVFSWSEAWIDGHGANVSGGLGLFTPGWAGPIARDFTINGDRNSANVQNGLNFYDREDQVDLFDVDIGNLTGSCISSGTLLNATQGYMRESVIDTVRMFYCGSSGHPAFLLDTEGGAGTDGTNEIKMSNIDIFAFFGHGLQIKNNATSGATRSVRITKLRIEGIQFDPVQISADNLVIGDNVAVGQVDGVECFECEIVSAYPGQNGIRLDAPGAGTQPYFIRYHGTIGGGGPIGGGILVNYGRDSWFDVDNINSMAPNLTLSANAGSNIQISNSGNSLGSWTYQINGGALAWAPTYSGDPGGLANGTRTNPGVNASLNAFAANNAANGGNAPGSNAFNLGGHGGNPYNIASGQFSVGIGGTGNQAGGTGTVAIGGNLVQLNGQYSSGIGGLRTSDRGMYGARCHASGSLTDFSGDANFCDQVLRCQAAASANSTCQATADGAAASTINEMNIPNNAAYTIQLDCAAIDRTTVGNNETWPTYTMLLTRGATVGTTALAKNATPTPLTNGTVTGSAISATADTTNGGLNVTFTSPNANAHLWDFTCHVQAHQVQ